MGVNVYEQVLLRSTHSKYHTVVGLAMIRACGIEVPLITPVDDAKPPRRKRKHDRDVLDCMRQNIGAMDRAR